mmetsp:Transcript_19198/g.55889  ORF Transcript_19198/g.55889 Transcript_19198/m.55889 type:complete len:205 (-) Transcript_19198:2162-2776(-)
MHLLNQVRNFGDTQMFAEIIINGLFIVDIVFGVVQVADANGVECKFTVHEETSGALLLHFLVRGKVEEAQSVHIVLDNEPNARFDECNGVIPDGQLLIGLAQQEFRCQAGEELVRWPGARVEKSQLPGNAGGVHEQSPHVAGMIFGNQAQRRAGGFGFLVLPENIQQVPPAPQRPCALLVPTFDLLIEPRKHGFPPALLARLPS